MTGIKSKLRAFKSKISGKRKKYTSQVGPQILRNNDIGPRALAKKKRKDNI